MSDNTTEVRPFIVRQGAPDSWLIIDTSTDEPVASCYTEEQAKRSAVYYTDIGPNAR